MTIFRLHVTKAHSPTTTMLSFWPFHNHHYHYHHHHHHHHHHHKDEIPKSAISLPSSRPSSPKPKRSSSLVFGSSTQRRRQRRTQVSSVSFFPQVIQTDHIHINDFTEEEKANSYYSPGELFSIKEGNIKTVQWMLNGGGFNSDDSNPAYCSRGMEYKTFNGSQLRRRRRKKSMDACFAFQSSEWNNGIDHPCSESLAITYSRHTQQSAHDAWLIAQVDHKQAMNDSDTNATTTIEVNATPSSSKQTVDLSAPHPIDLSAPQPPMSPAPAA